MNKGVLVLSCLMAVSILSGCATRSRAPVLASGEKVHIYVVSDRGNSEEMESRQWEYRSEVGNFMEPNLVRRLKDYGYDSTLLKSKSEFKPGKDRYLLCTKMTSYNPGSSAARMLVGFGAGSASLNMHYDFYETTSKKVLSWDDGVGTSQHWSKLPTKLNINTALKLNEYFTPTK